MIFYGKVIEIQQRQVHHATNPNPEPQETFAYMDFPKMPMSRLWLKIDREEFQAGDEVVLRIDLK